MTFGRLHRIKTLYNYSYLNGSSKSCSNPIGNALKFNHHGISSFSCNLNHDAVAASGNRREIPRILASNSFVSMGDVRSLATQAAAAQAKPPSQARQTGSFKVSMTSPGIVYEPYAPRKPIAFWRRCFTRSGWRRTKEDIIMELKSAYAIAKLRKSGYSKQKFYTEALEMYKQINTLIATGDKTLLRKTVTDKLYSGLKNEIKVREKMWSSVHWELVEPIIKIRTLQARLIGVDRNDTNKVFIQLTMDFLAKQRFEAYDSEGKVVAGDKNKEVLVRDIWVFEKSMFLPGSYWRLCARINP